MVNPHYVALQATLLAALRQATDLAAEEEQQRRPTTRWLLLLEDDAALAPDFRRRPGPHTQCTGLSTHTVHLRSVHTTDSVRTAWGTGEHHY